MGLSFRKILTYRADFWVNFFGSVLLQLFIARSLWASIFKAQGVTHLKGYDLTQFTFYYLMAPLCVRILTGENIGFISREIYEGGLNKFLIYPVSYRFFKFFSYISYSLFYLFQLFFLTCLFILIYPEFIATLNFVSVLLGVVFLFFSILFYFLGLSLLEMAAFWADNVWSLGVVFRFAIGFMGGLFIPLRFFPTVIQDILHYTPFPWLISAPINLFMGDLPIAKAISGFAIISCWIIVMLLLNQFVWNKGKYRYTGIGI